MNHKATNLFNKSAIKVLLKPFTWLYGGIMDMRNFLYNRNVLTSTNTKQFSVVVGNLTVGGTGKTPMVEYILHSFLETEKIVSLSRGYGRLSQGFMLASPESTAEDIGDEPLQYYKKFGKKSKVAVCENRVAGSKKLHKLFPDHRLLLLDDAFQHRSLKPDVAIVLNDYNRPFYKDEPFPGGRLRERRRGIMRANAVITTKCPDSLSKQEKLLIVREIQRFSVAGTPIFFSKVKYGQLRSFEGIAVTVKEVRVVVGIAQPNPFVEYLRQNFRVVHVATFPDHYHYTEADVQKMVRDRNKDEVILTTEKDMVKLLPLAKKAKVMSNFAYIPIEVDFGEDTDPFQNWLRNVILIPLQNDSKGTL